MAKLKLIDRKSGKRYWVGKAKDDWNLTYVIFENKENHTVLVDGSKLQVNFIHNTQGPRQAVHFEIEDGRYSGWYFLYDPKFSVYSTKYDFELIEVEER